MNPDEKLEELYRICCENESVFGRFVRFAVWRTGFVVRLPPLGYLACAGGDAGIESKAADA